MTSDHDFDDLSENFCCRINMSKGDLMPHRKETHSKTIKICCYFQMGRCAFDEKTCWYSHKTDSPNNSPIPKTLPEFHCSFCDKIFQRKSEFMKHRKDNHPENISECRESING